MWDNVSTGTPKLWCVIYTWPQKQLHTHPVILVPCLCALWRYKAERDHPAADALVWCSMKMIVVQTIIYDVYLTRTGNCDIGTSHECETVGLKQYGTERVRNGFIAGAIVKITQNRVIVNVYLQELCYILVVMNLWDITVKCMVYVGSLYLYGGPSLVTETVRLIVLLLCSYAIGCFGDFKILLIKIIKLLESESI